MRMRKIYYSKEIQPGDILKHKADVFSVIECIPVSECVSSCEIPNEWPDHHKKDPFRLRYFNQNGLRHTAVIPYDMPSNLHLLARVEDEGHYPTCGKCMEPWPCSHKEMLSEVKQAAEKAIEEAQLDFEKPYKCEWCSHRYLTERGRDQHMRGQKKLGCVGCGVSRCSAKGYFVDYSSDYKGTLTCGDCQRAKIGD